MDFVVGLPHSPRGKDAIWVVIDRLTKVARFIPMKQTSSAADLVPLYIMEVVRLHGVPKFIVSDRDFKFVSKFWQSLHNAMGTKLDMSVVFHPQTDGQSERTIQTLEDMLRACVLSWKGNCEDHLILAEFAYNNSYHANIKMTPYESLYGHKCISPLCWEVPSECLLVDPDWIQQTHDKVHQIRQNMLTTQNQQKSYADVRRRDLEFAVGDEVLLKVSRQKELFILASRGSLAPDTFGLI
jgi:hypothetical protein